MVHRKFRKYRSVQNKNYDNLMTFSLENEDVWYPDYFLMICYHLWNFNRNAAVLTLREF